MACSARVGKVFAMRWTPSGDDYRLLQIAGFLTMALLFGSAMVPRLRPYARRIGIVAALGYLVFGLAILGYHLAG
jgi:hypothetical protein